MFEQLKLAEEKSIRGKKCNDSGEIMEAQGYSDCCEAVITKILITGLKKRVYMYYPSVDSRAPNLKEVKNCDIVFLVAKPKNGEHVFTITGLGVFKDSGILWASTTLKLSVDLPCETYLDNILETGDIEQCHEDDIIGKVLFTLATS